MYGPSLFIISHDVFTHTKHAKFSLIPLTVDLEQQAGLLASEKQYNDQLQDEVRKLVGEAERLRQESEVYRADSWVFVRARMNFRNMCKIVMILTIPLLSIPTRSDRLN